MGNPCSLRPHLIYAALQFTLFSAIAFSLLSVAFSSSRFCCRTEAQSLAAKHVGPCYQRAVARDLIVLDGLGCGDEGSIEYLLVIDVTRDFARLFQDAVDGRTIDALGSTPCI